MTHYGIVFLRLKETIETILDGVSDMQVSVLLFVCAHMCSCVC